MNAEIHARIHSESLGETQKSLGGVGGVDLCTPIMQL